MVGCYVVFFGGMTALVAGSGFALFMVAISILYAVIFFSTGTHPRKPVGHTRAVRRWTRERRFRPGAAR